MSTLSLPEDGALSCSICFCAHHERLDGDLGVTGGLEVEHGGVGVLRDLAEDDVLGARPDVELAVALGRLLVEALDEDPLDHDALEDEDGLEGALEGDLDERVVLRPVRPGDIEVHVGVESAD